jgi:hypothetical protein
MSKLYYHYTDAATALKILTNQELWLTHTSFLNDANEGSDLLKHLSKHIENQDILKLLYFIDTRTDAYSCSFSKQKDLLSQWRGYCPPEEGYAIGFKSPDKFRDFMCDDGLSIVGAPTKDDTYILTRHSHGFKACIYEDNKKEEICKKMASYMEEDYFRLQVDMNDFLTNLDSPPAKLKDFLHRLEVGDVWLSEYLYYKYLFKNENFKEEEEYRFFLTFDMNYKQNPCYRVKNGVFIPYYRYSFDNKDVQKVVIRTTKSKNKCEQGLRHFLKNNKKMSQDEIELFIETSNIPFQ